MENGVYYYKRIESKSFPSPVKGEGVYCQDTSCVCIRPRQVRCAFAN